MGGGGGGCWGGGVGEELSGVVVVKVVVLLLYPIYLCQSTPPLALRMRLVEHHTLEQPLSWPLQLC